ncbi:MAG: helix-turn-helix transcriptional regulator [Ruthenibacterium sp.]
MSILYDRIAELCADRGIAAYRMCKDLGVQPSLVTELKMGRKNGMKAETAEKIATYFGVTVGYLLGSEQKEKPVKHNDGPLGDVEIYRIERARKKMPDSEKKKMMQILELSFEEYFSDDYADTDTDE